MITTDDFLEPFTTAHDLQDQTTRLGMSFTFVDEIALFETHQQRLALEIDGYTVFMVDFFSIRIFACRMLCNNA